MRALQTLKFGQLPIEIIDGDRGKNYPKKSDFQTEGIPFLNSAAIHEGRIDFRLSNYITEDKYEMIKKGRVYKDDIILTTRGNGIGKVALFVTTKDYQEALINAQMLVVRTLTGKFDPDYLFYLIKSPIFQTQVTNFASGSAQPQLPIRDLKDIPVSVLKYQEQVLVGKTLREYDNLIENNNRRIAILEDMAQSLYREWFVHFRFPGHENCQFKDSDLGRIPEGWEVKKLDNVINIYRGRSYRSQDLVGEEGYPFLNLKNVAREGGFRRDGLKNYTGPFKEHHIAKPNDIIMAVTDMTQERAIIARPARVPEMGYEKFIYSMDLIKIKVIEGIDESFIYSLLRYSDFPHIVKQFANGANVLHLKPQIVGDYEAIIPSQSIMSKFTKTIKEIHKQQDLLERKNDNLVKQRDMLLPKLISGTINL